jgi:hypothetical protein
VGIVGRAEIAAGLGEERVGAHALGIAEQAREARHVHAVRQGGIEPHEVAVGRSELGLEVLLRRPRAPRGDARHELRDLLDLFQHVIVEEHAASMARSTRSPNPRLALPVCPPCPSTWLE